MIVWVLYDESGEYSSYRLGILGVFINPDLAKNFVANYCQKAVVSHPSNYIYAHRTEWVLDSEDGAWHCEVDSDSSYGSNVSWTIAPYRMNEAQ